MSQNLAEELGLPPVDQVAWVVDDLDRAVETFAPLFGPFTTMQQELKGAQYRGREADVTLRIGFGRSGPLEIELIEVVSGESPHSEDLAKKGEGVHHIRFRVDDLDPPIERLQALGYEVVWSHAMPQISTRWAYLEGPAGGGGALVELLQMPQNLGG